MVSVDEQLRRYASWLADEADRQAGEQGPTLYVRVDGEPPVAHRNGRRWWPLAAVAALLALVVGLVAITGVQDAQPPADRPSPTDLDIEAPDPALVPWDVDVDTSGWSDEVRADAAAIQALMDDNVRFMEELLAEDWTEDHWDEYVENMLANAEPDFLQLQEELCPNPVQAHRRIWDQQPVWMLSSNYGYLVSVDFDTLRPDPDWRVGDYGGRAHDIPASGRTYVVRTTSRSLGDVTGFLNSDTAVSNETFEDQMAVTEWTQDQRFNVQDGRAYWFDHISFDATCW